MTKVLIIGIDGLDPELIFKWQDDLPYFKKLSVSGHAGKIESVFPPDSVPAWASIFTGMTPAQHGVSSHINYLSSGREVIDNSSIIGKTFWDVAGKKGKKVCIINPFMCYPPWPVNGTMISGPVMIDGAVQTYPATIKLDGVLPDIGGITDFPDKNELDSFIEKNFKDVERLYNLSVNQFQSGDHDLCFVTFLQLDRIQHFLWRYTDEDDSTYPGVTRYRDSIKSAYKLIDNIIGKFLKSLDNQTTLIVISDHGHGRRCTNVLNINEILRQHGYLKSKVGRLKILDPKYILEQTKLRMLETIYHYDLEDIMYLFSKYIPNRQSLKKSTFMLDTSDSIASVSTVGGTNPFGGIVINNNYIHRMGVDYEAIRGELIALLNSVNNAITDRPVFKWIKCREEIDNGPFINIYPDILFELDESYGVSWAVHTNIVGINTTHKKISGGHRRNGFIGIFNAPGSSAVFNSRVQDVCDFILNILEINAEEITIK